jgi:hypothetical protein
LTKVESESQPIQATPRCLCQKQHPAQRCGYDKLWHAKKKRMKHATAINSFVIMTMMKCSYRAMVPFVHVKVGVSNTQTKTPVTAE